MVRGKLTRLDAKQKVGDETLALDGYVLSRRQDTDYSDQAPFSSGLQTLDERSCSAELDDVVDAHAVGQPEDFFLPVRMGFVVDGICSAEGASEFELRV